MKLILIPYVPHKIYENKVTREKFSIRLHIWNYGRSRILHSNTTHMLVTNQFGYYSNTFIANNFNSFLLMLKYPEKDKHHTMVKQQNKANVQHNLIVSRTVTTQKEYCIESY